jgi:hypothetical protein
MPTESVLRSDELKLLTEVGFLALNCASPVMAARVFDPLAKVVPQRAYAWVGLAYAYLNAAQPGEAVRVLERARGIMRPDESSDEDIALVTALLGFALHHARRQGECVKLLATLIHRPADDPGGRIARSLMGVPNHGH